MECIVSIDPGKATGFVVADYDPVTGNFLPLGQFTLSSDETMDYLRLLAHDDPGVTVVYESFELNAGNQFTADLSGVEIIGALKFAFPPERLHARRRTDKVQVPDSLLKEHGLWVTGKDVGWEDGRDANDAMIHLIGFLCFDRQDLMALRRFF